MASFTPSASCVLAMGPYVSDSAASQQIEQCLRSGYSAMSDYVSAHEQTVTGVVGKHLAPAYRKVESDGRITVPSRNKLIVGYQETADSLAKEEASLRAALADIYKVRKVRTQLRLAARNAGNKETLRRGTLMKMLANSAATIPLWVGNTGANGDDVHDSMPPPLCGAVPADPDYVASPGDMAAALVKSSDGDENWILTEVVAFHPASANGNGGDSLSQGKYEVDDIDEEQKERHQLPRRKVIPLPTMRASPLTTTAHRETVFYAKGSVVMALYPQTTCFYKGVIKEVPSTATDDYLVLFEDSTYPDGFSPPLHVAQRYVIQDRQDSTAVTPNKKR